MQINSFLFTCYSKGIPVVIFKEFRSQLKKFQLKKLKNPKKLPTIPSAPSTLYLSKWLGQIFVDKSRIIQELFKSYLRIIQEFRPKFRRKSSWIQTFWWIINRNSQLLFNFSSLLALSKARWTKLLFQDLCCC